ncbi:hypothetical protein HY950_01655 [Candidatus Gottesmanbacteria bacterium]|nr:hypothetical protein [Candidatus Gottesmanbacteria bacterium]
MKYNIGIFGSAVEESKKIMATARLLGKILGNHDHSIRLLFGACPGVPYEVAAAAQAASSVEIIGFSSETSREAQLSYSPKDNLSMYTSIRFVPKGFEFSANSDVRKKYRNVLLTASVDAGIVVSGRWGSLNEFTDLYDMGKVIGVLTGTGGVADELPSLSKKIHKPSKAVVLFDSSPEQLVKRIIEELKRRTLPKSS